MSAVENSKLAIEEHQKIHVLRKMQKTETEAKNKMNPKSRKAAMFSSLDSLANMLTEERASDQVAKDEQEMNKRRLGSSNGTPGGADDTKGSKKSGKAGKKGKSSPSSSQKDGPTPTPTPTPPKPVKHESMFDQTMDHDDPLVALLMAGITIQEKTNGMLSGLAKTGELISKASTDAAKAGNLWMKNFYNHGETGNAGEYDTSTTTKTEYMIYYDGNYYVTDKKEPTGIRSIDWENWLVALSKTTPHKEIPKGFTHAEATAARKGGFKDNYMGKGHIDAYNTNGNVQHQKYSFSNCNGIPGAAGPANSAEFSTLMSVWQYVQSQVSQTNNQFQTVAGLPSTMMQSLMQAISTGRGAESSTSQAIGVAANFVNGWAGV